MVSSSWSGRSLCAVASSRSPASASNASTAGSICEGSILSKGRRNSICSKGFISKEVRSRKSASRQHARRIAGEVRQDKICACAADGRERFHHNAVVIQPTVADGGHDHAELARYLIRSQRHWETVARLADQVQIRKRGLYHQHVRALFEIELHLVHGLAGVGRVHLIGAPVPERRRGFGGFAKRSVESRGELRG